MRDINLLAQTSLDGFVAGPKGEFDHFTAGEETLEFVCGLTDNADAAMFGRVSYELLEPYWPTARKQTGRNKKRYQIFQLVQFGCQNSLVRKFAERRFEERYYYQRSSFA